MRFVRRLGAAGTVLAATGKSKPSGATQPGVGSEPEPQAQAKTWLFWNLWHLEGQHNLELCQGQPKWVREAVYVDEVDGLAAWPTVYRDEASGRWRMLYTARWRPYTLIVPFSNRPALDHNSIEVSCSRSRAMSPSATRVKM